MSTKTARIATRLTPSLLESLDTIVANGLGDRSDHVRQAITEYIARHAPAPTPEPVEGPPAEA